MKIRNGFVSNSSSSSFLIYGICIEEDELLDLLKVSEEEREADDFYAYDIIDEKISKFDLEYHCPDGYDGCYIGRSWASVGDDETGKQFKESVAADLKKIFGKKFKCSTFEEAYYG